MRKLLISALLFVCALAPAYAWEPDWIVFSDNPVNPWHTYYAKFVLEGNTLNLDGYWVEKGEDSYWTVPWNPISTKTPDIYLGFCDYVKEGGVVLYGKWAVCGTVANNQWTPDPYAQFVITAPGSGYVSWSPNTPDGYTAPIVVGGAFEGSGAPEVKSYRWWAGDPPLTTSTYGTCYAYQPDYQWSCWYMLSHTFNVTYTSPVPEPSGIICLVAGMGSLIGLRKLRSR